MGVSPTRYRNRARVTRAVDRIAAGAPGLSDLAVRLGFADQDHLTAPSASTWAAPRPRCAACSPPARPRPEPDGRATGLAGRRQAGGTRHGTSEPCACPVDHPGAARAARVAGVRPGRGRAAPRLPVPGRVRVGGGRVRAAGFRAPG
ncbi:hypothetical protein ABZ747_06315 [Kitasatospora cineracea]|uniref:hypothetical protein n=1 Tax=Kitasatospora cineracea TaxID=88074 RepID=UPI0033EABBC8